MTWERRINGIYWTNRSLGIIEMGPFPLNYRFYNDGQEKICEVVWPGTWDNGIQGWEVCHAIAIVVHDGIPIGVKTLVLFSEEGGVEGFPKNRIRRIPD